MELAVGSDLDGYFVVAGSPSPSVGQYLMGDLAERLQEPISTETPRVEMAFHAVGDLSDVEAISQGLRDLIDRVDSP